jgi:hypothetical protein
MGVSRSSDAYLRDTVDPKIDTIEQDTTTDLPAAMTTVVQANVGVPSPDAVTNTLERDVIGNKSDAEKTGPIDTATSLMGYTKHIFTGADLITQQVGATDTLAPLALPQTGATSLWDVTGVVEVISVFGIISTVIGSVANATKLIANPAAGPSVDLCATVDLNAAAAGGILHLSGIFADNMILTAGAGAGPSGAFESQAGRMTVTQGSIDVDCAGSDGGAGRVDWVIVWRPISIGATLLPA